MLFGRIEVQRFPNTARMLLAAVHIRAYEKNLEPGCRLSCEKRLQFRSRPK